MREDMQHVIIDRPRRGGRGGTPAGYGAGAATNTSSAIRFDT